MRKEARQFGRTSSESKALKVFQAGSPQQDVLEAVVRAREDADLVLLGRVRLHDVHPGEVLLDPVRELAEALLDAKHTLHEETARPHLAGEELQQQKRRFVRPMQVVEDHDDGLAARRVTQERHDGIEEAESTGATVFQAGTRMGAKGLETSGGRVLGVTAWGENLTSARDAAYAAAEKIRFDGAQFRRDIAAQALRWD